MPNFPQYSIIQQRENTEGKRNKKKVAPNKPKLMLLSGFFFPFGLFFKQKVSKHTRLFSGGHNEYLNGSSTALSWLEIIPRHL